MLAAHVVMRILHELNMRHTATMKAQFAPLARQRTCSGLVLRVAECRQLPHAHARDKVAAGLRLNVQGRRGIPHVRPRMHTFVSSTLPRRRTHLLQLSHLGRRRKGDVLRLHRQDDRGHLALRIHIKHGGIKHPGRACLEHGPALGAE